MPTLESRAKARQEREERGDRRMKNR